jgi:hypothetical protein
LSKVSIPIRNILNYKLDINITDLSVIIDDNDANWRNNKFKLMFLKYEWKYSHNDIEIIIILV